MVSLESTERKIHHLCPFLNEVNTSSVISLGNFCGVVFILAAELAFCAVRSADAHLLLLWYWFSIEVIILNSDSRFSECSYTQLTGLIQAFRVAGRVVEYFSPSGEF